MLITQAAFGGNHLLNLLTDNSRKGFIEHCAVVELELGDVLNYPGESINYVYFPTEGIISWEKQITDSPYLVISLIGNEGMLTTCAMLGVNVSPCRAVVQKNGLVYRIPVDVFLRQIAQIPALDLILKQYAFIAHSQVLQTAACNLFHVLEKRLARLILMFQDRSRSDELHITQELLAQMLGVRRVGVTKAAGSLQRQNLISYSRGNVVVHDALGLKAVSCLCYQADIEVYEHTLHKPVMV